MLIVVYSTVLRVRIGARGKSITSLLLFSIQVGFHARQNYLRDGVALVSLRLGVRLGIRKPCEEDLVKLGNIN